MTAVSIQSMNEKMNRLCTYKASLIISLLLSSANCDHCFNKCIFQMKYTVTF